MQVGNHPSIQNGRQQEERNPGQRVAGPGGLSSSFFNNGGEVLKSEFTKLLGSISPRKQNPKDGCDSLIVPIHKDGENSSCENLTGIS